LVGHVPLLTLLFSVPVIAVRLFSVLIVADCERHGQDFFIFRENSPVCLDHFPVTDRFD
jgi:hypothetical protein